MSLAAMAWRLQGSGRGGREPATAAIQVLSEVAWPGGKHLDMVGREWTLNLELYPV